MTRFLLVCAFTLAVSVSAQEHQESAGEQPSLHASESHRMTEGMGHMHSMIRHRYVMRVGIPAAYEELVNPLTPTATVLANGQRIYSETCSACHGATGAGDGPGAAALDPPPSNIRRLPRMPMLSSDAYLYWTVAEGGQPIETGMPGFGQTLTSDQIWSVILYVRQAL